MLSKTWLATALAAAVLTPTINASNLEMPLATAFSIFNNGGMSPKPTSAPNNNYIGGGHLLHRQNDNSIQSALIAPDQTCGYVSGIPGAYYTCVGDFTCAMLTAQATRTGNVACCNTNNCNVRTACINYDEFYNSTACGNACRVDSFIVKCTNPEMRFCNTVSFSKSIFDYWCNSEDPGSVQEAFTTYFGQTGHTFSTLALSGSVSATGITGDLLPTGTNSGNTDNSNSNSGNNGNNSSNDNGGGGGAPLPAIIGGAVGGVVGLAIIGIIIWLVLRNKRKKKAAAEAAAAASAMQQQQQQQPPPVNYQTQSPPPQHDPHGSVYDPKYAAALAAATNSYSPQNQGQQFAPPPPQQQNQQYPPQYPTNGYYNNNNNNNQQSIPPSSTSPTMSSTSPVADPRLSQMSAASPVQSQGYPPHSGYQHGGNTIYEAPSRPEETNRGGVHELG